MKKPIKCSAPKYIDYLMTWVQEQLDDENIFPSKIGIIVLQLFTLEVHGDQRVSCVQVILLDLYWRYVYAFLTARMRPVSGF